MAAFEMESKYITGLGALVESLPPELRSAHRGYAPTIASLRATVAVAQHYQDGRQNDARQCGV